MPANLQVLRAEPRWLSHAEVAVYIRQALKAAFPSVKFSVRSKSYSMGSSVHVSYEKGPRPSEVEKVARSFQGIGFDGMDDSTHYNAVTLPSGEVVRAGSYVSVSRPSGPDWKAEVERAKAMIEASCACEGGRFGNEWVDNLASGVVHNMDYRDADPMAASFRRVVLRETD